MENDLITIVALSITILFIYNRYIILTSKIALKEREKLTHKMGDFIENNDNVSHELKEILIVLHHKSMTKFLLNSFLYSAIFQNKEILKSNKVAKDYFTNEEYDFLHSCVSDMFKINFLYTPTLYITYGIFISLILIIPLLLAIISSKLIGGFKAIDNFLNKDTDFYVSSLNLHKI